MDKRTYREILGAEIATLRRRIDAAQSHTAAEPAARRVADAGLAAVLSHRMDVLRHKMEEASQLPDGAWTRIRLELDKDWDDLSTAFERLSGRLP